MQQIVDFLTPQNAERLALAIVLGLFAGLAFCLFTFVYVAVLRFGLGDFGAADKKCNCGRKQKNIKTENREAKSEGE